MKDSLSSVSLAPYFDIIYRHRLSFICTLSVGLILTTIAVIVLPNIYLSSTLVTIEPQEVPAQYVSEGVTNHIRDRLKILSEKALSRTQLEGLIREFGLYRERRARHTPPEQIVGLMRSHIKLEVTKEDDHSGGGAFELSFEYPDAAVAQKITQKLAESFISEDRRGRTQDAKATSDFLEDRLAEARSKLDLKSQEIRDYKDHHQGSLPQDLAVNLQTLGSLQARLEAASQAQLAMEERRVQISREMADSQNLTLASPTGSSSALSPKAQLAAMRADLTRLRARYSDKYPDVVNLQAQITALEQQIKTAPPDQQQDALTQFDSGFRRESEQIAIEQQRLNAEMADTKRDIATYQQRIADTPVHQQEYDALNRDYTVLNDDYNSLLNKRLAAQAAQSLEERGEGEHFRVIDPANLPRSAESPDKTAIAIGGATFSLFAAIGIAVGLFMLDTSFKEAEEIVSELGLPVAVMIPDLGDAGDRWEDRALRLRAVIGSGITVIAGATAIWFYAASRL